MATWQWMNLGSICLLVILLDLTVQGWAFNCTLKNTYDGYSCDASSRPVDPGECENSTKFINDFYDGLRSKGRRRKRDAEVSSDSRAAKTFWCVAQFQLIQENEPSSDEPDIPTTYSYAAAYGCIYDTKENLEEYKMNGCTKLDDGSKQMDEFCMCNTKSDCNNAFKPGFKAMRKIKPVCGQRKYEVHDDGPDEISEDASQTVVGNLVLTVAFVLVIGFSHY